MTRPHTRSEPTAALADAHRLADAIRQARKQTGLSQDELAAQLGIRQSSISQWERGTTLPSTRHLLGLLAALGHPFATLLVDLAVAQLTQLFDSQSSRGVPRQDAASATNASESSTALR